MGKETYNEGGEVKGKEREAYSEELRHEKCWDCTIKSTGITNLLPLNTRGLTQYPTKSV